MDNTKLATTENGEKKKKDRGFILDIIVALVAVVALIICQRYWGCDYDLPATILAIVVVLAGSGLLYMQHRKNNKAIEEANKEMTNNRQ